MRGRERVGLARGRESRVNERERESRLTRGRERLG